MQDLVDILKGVIIGVANVIPGVSGGTLAISMGIYNTLIDAVSGFFKSPYNSIKMVWKYALGMVIGILLSIFAVSYLFEVLPVLSSMLFIGLIIGTIPDIINNIEKNKIKIIDIITICTIIIMVMTLGFIDGNIIEINNGTLTSNVGLLFLIGIIIALTIVIPGISGSAVLMVLGCYTSIINIAKDTIQHIFSFNIIQAFNTGKMLIFLIIGVIIGIFLTAKLIKILTKKYPNTVSCGIAALITTTPLLVIMKLDFSNITVVETIFSILILIVGAQLAKKLSKGDG